jgi:CBS domain-containing protein
MSPGVQEVILQTSETRGGFAMKVDDVMTREVITVPPGASLKQAAHLFIEYRISGLPVVDNENHVLGVISETDVLPKEAEGQAKADAHLVGEAMTSPAVTVEADRPLGAAAKLILERGVNRLPVVDNAKLVGIVTRADLVRAFVRSDAEIAREIRDDVIVRDLWLDKKSVQVEVEDGEVTLTGTLGSRADADVTVALVRRVPGVVGVHPNLTWTDEDIEC